MLDFVVLHHAALGHDFFQEQAKSGNVPLTIAQCIKRSALGVFGTNLESRVERATRGEHAQVPVEHQKWFANRIYDRLRESTGFLELLQQFILFALQDALRGDILDAEQDRDVGAALVENLASVQTHGAVPEAGEFVLDLIAFHHALLGDDFFQKHTKLRDVPLAIAQRIKRPALSVVRLDLECGIEGAAGGNHPQLVVEHQDRLADRVDDALGECPCIRDGGKLFSETCRLHKASSKSPCASKATPVNAGALSA
jgi:hypothetical protein